MPTVLLSPIGNGQQFFDDAGLPLAGGIIYTYQAGSTTPLTTYTTNAGSIPNTNPIILDSAGRSANEIWLQEGYNYKFVVQTAAAVTIQTLDNIYGIPSSSSSGGSSIPSGMIAIWSGSIGSVPSGWLLCNGTNGTPDLRNSFILGAGDTYSVGQTGGSKDAIVVAHTHTVTGQSGGTGSVTSFATATGASGTAVTTESTGSSGTNANMPPYYALAFIMKS